MTASGFIKSLWIWGVALSLFMCFYTMVYKHDFVVVTNEDGIPILEEE